jgi:DnaJ-class molecular chaperone
MTTKALKEKAYVLAEYELYTILGVEPGITQEQLMVNYKDLVKKYHPARASFQLMSARDLRDHKLIFAKLSNAYNILIDPESRNKYDSLRKETHIVVNGFQDIYEKMAAAIHEKPFKSKLHILDETDLYVILDVDPAISGEELTRHYRQLAKKYHPDKYSFQIISGKELKELNLIFAKITDTYNLLKDPDQRARYDQTRVMAEQKGESSFTPPSTTENIFRNSKIDPEKAKKEQAEKFFILGKNDFNNNQLDNAIKNLKSAIEIFQKEGKYHFYLGQAMEKKGWHEYAKSEYKLTLLYEPQHLTALEKMKQYDMPAPDLSQKDKKTPGLFNKITSIFQKK